MESEEEGPRGKRPCSSPPLEGAFIPEVCKEITCAPPGLENSHYLEFFGMDDLPFLYTVIYSYQDGLAYLFYSFSSNLTYWLFVVVCLFVCVYQIVPDLASWSFCT